MVKKTIEDYKEDLQIYKEANRSNIKKKKIREKACLILLEHIEKEELIYLLSELYDFKEKQEVKNE